MMILGSLRTLPALALTTAAKTLRLLATINETIAQRLDVPSPPTPSDVQPRAPQASRARPAQPAPSRTAASAVSTSAQEFVRDETAPAAADVPALAARTVPEILAALDGLSTEDLGELYIYESSHRRRRTVLRAVEAASEPPASSDEPDDLPPLDVRLDDELVYSTATPPR